MSVRTRTKRVRVGLLPSGIFSQTLNLESFATELRSSQRVNLVRRRWTLSVINWTVGNFCDCRCGEISRLSVSVHFCLQHDALGATVAFSLVSSQGPVVARASALRRGDIRLGRVCSKCRDKSSPQAAKLRLRQHRRQRGRRAHQSSGRGRHPRRELRHGSADPLHLLLYIEPAGRSLHRLAEAGRRRSPHTASHRRLQVVPARVRQLLFQSVT